MKSLFDLTQIPDMVPKINEDLVKLDQNTRYLLKPPVKCTRLKSDKVMIITEVVTRPGNKLELIPSYPDIIKMTINELKDELEKRKNRIIPGTNKKTLTTLLKRSRGTLILPIQQILNLCPSLILNISIATGVKIESWL